MPQQNQPPDLPEQPDQQEKKPRKNAAASELMEWVKAFAIALVVAIILTQFIIVNAQVPSESMEDTIQVGDRVIGFRLSYLFSEPQRGDIVIFRYPDDETKLYIKRVIGLPGEVVEIRDGQVYINGADAPLDAGFVKEEPMGDYGPYTVPEDSYFVMGDNRNHSWDSRFWNNTFVRADKIIGKGVVRIWPNPAVLE